MPQPPTNIEVTLLIENGEYLQLSGERVVFGVKEIRPRHIKLANNVLDMIRDIRSLHEHYDSKRFETKDANT